MTWIKLDEDTFAEENLPDPKRIVKISELQAEIDDLQAQIDSVVMLEYPEGASEELKNAINMVNDEKILFQQNAERQIEDKLVLLKELNGS